MATWSRIRQSDVLRSTPRWLLALAVVPILIAGTGTAYAFWSAMGSGTAEIKATTAQSLGVSSLTTPLADLYPGKTSNLGFVLSNPNPYAVSLTKLTAVSVTSTQSGCPGADHIVLPAAVTTGIAAGGYTLPTAISVPAGSTATNATLAGLITMSTSAPDACQGVTFTVSLAFSGMQG